MFAVELTTDVASGSAVCGNLSGGDTIDDAHRKINRCSLDLFLRRQQGSVLIVDDDAEVLETVCPAYYRKHQQEAQCAQSFQLFGHNAFLLIVNVKIIK